MLAHINSYEAKFYFILINRYVCILQYVSHTQQHNGECFKYYEVEEFIVELLQMCCTYFVAVTAPRSAVVHIK